MREGQPLSLALTEGGVCVARVRVNRLFRLGRVIYEPDTEHEMKKEQAQKLERMGFVVLLPKPKKAKSKGDQDAPVGDD